MQTVAPALAEPTPQPLRLFTYAATNVDGDVVKGVMEATQEDAVWQALASRGLRPMVVKQRHRPIVGQFLRGLTKVKSQEIIMFCRQLATFVRVGIPITAALETIGEGTGNKRMREACASMVADLERGSLLSDAIARHPQVFPSLLADLIRAAEITGRIDEVLVRAAEHFSREAEARAKIRAALVYPGIVFTMALAVALGMILFVLPKFKELFTEFHAKLPAMTAVMLDLSEFVRANSIYILLAILFGVLGGGAWVRSRPGKLLLTRFFLKVPYIGAMMRAATIERFCRSLSDTLAAGVPVGTSFAVVVASTRNVVYRAALGEVGSAVAVGDSFSRSLKRTGLFPPLVTQMVRVGEETGTLDEHLSEAAKMYDQELEFRIKKLTSFIEPALIVSVGVMVGIVAVSLVSAIYGFTSAIK